MTSALLSPATEVLLLYNSSGFFGLHVVDHLFQDGVQFVHILSLLFSVYDERRHARHIPFSSPFLLLDLSV